MKDRNYRNGVFEKQRKEYEEGRGREMNKSTGECKGQKMRGGWEREEDVVERKSGDVKGGR